MVNRNLLICNEIGFVLVFAKFSNYYSPVETVFKIAGKFQYVKVNYLKKDREKYNSYF